MPWYRAGTVSVTLNSNAVVGTGTAFVANSRVGDAFLGPDGGWYEVTNIASNTALSITPNYRGATNAAGVYALTPVQGYTKDLADQARAMIQQWGSTLAGLGSASTENIVPVAKGGTGSSTAAAARSSLGLGTAAVAALLGTVSQSGGVPTGAIIERGTNANGDYTKFADGTLVCSIRTLAVPYAAANYLAANWTFPATFSALPRVFPAQGAVVDAFKLNRGVPGATGDTSYAAIRVFATGTDTYVSGDSATLQIFALGRWF